MKLNHLFFLQKILVTKRIILFMSSNAFLLNTQAFTVCEPGLYPIYFVLQSGIDSNLKKSEECKKAENLRPKNMSNHNNQPQDSDIVVSLTPNPSKNNFRLLVSFASDKKIIVNIFDPTGKRLVSIYSITNHVMFIGNDLMPGFYFAEIIIANKRKRIKFEKAD